MACVNLTDASRLCLWFQLDHVYVVKFESGLWRLDVVSSFLLVPFSMEVLAGVGLCKPCLVVDHIYLKVVCCCHGH